MGSHVDEGGVNDAVLAPEPYWTPRQNWTQTY